VTTNLWVSVPDGLPPRYVLVSDTNSHVPATVGTNSVTRNEHSMIAITGGALMPQGINSVTDYAKGPEII
jgi:hypothetical protein